MVSYEDKWVRIFLVQDVSHQKRFTLYKIVSMLYPKDCPDAITKVTVWKRFNDFKKLHHSIKTKSKSLNNSNCTNLPKTSYFKRFQESVIEERRNFILNFLNFVGQHPELYTSDAFVKFFKTSYTPSELLCSNINSIRSDLNLPAETEYYIANYSDEENTLSEEDSVSTVNSFSSSLVQIDKLPDPLNEDANSVKHYSSENGILAMNTNLKDTDMYSVDGQDVCSSSAHSYSSVCSLGNYILEAAQYITHAIQCETEKRYEDAFQEYKTGIEILMKNSKDEKNIDRKEMVRQKIEKYLLRQEKIYNLYLSPEIKDIRQYVSNYSEDDDNISCVPVSDLYKYKVIKIVGSGMVVLHIESQQLFYAKVIYKTSTFKEENLVLPNNVPYFVQLKNYFNCENAIFLILQYVSTSTLVDYIKQKFETKKLKSCESLAPENVESKASNCNSGDEESDYSYTDLINDYTSSRFQKELDENIPEVETTIENQTLVSEETDPLVQENNEQSHETSLLAFDLECNENVDNIVVKSEELISTVDETLRGEKEVLEFFHDEKVDTTNVEEYEFISSPHTGVALSVEYFFDEIPSDLPPFNLVVKWSAQLLLALEKLHSMEVIYGNMQMKHLLLDGNENLLLSYKCRIRSEYHTVINEDYIPAPEFYNFQKITTAVDWWSYGIILYQLLVGMDFKLVHPEEFTFYTVLRIPKYVPVEGRSILKQLIVFDPKDRLGSGSNGTDEIKSHPFFNSISWNTLSDDGMKSLSQF